VALVQQPACNLQAKDWQTFAMVPVCGSTAPPYLVLLLEWLPRTSNILKLKNLDHFLRRRHSQVLKAVNTLASQPPATASSMKAQICKT
jgi:hypothetical protein